jgi:hypothetical protein
MTQSEIASLKHDIERYVGIAAWMCQNGICMADSPHKAFHSQEECRLHGEELAILKRAQEGAKYDIWWHCTESDSSAVKEGMPHYDPPR